MHLILSAFVFSPWAPRHLVDNCLSDKQLAERHLAVQSIKDTVGKMAGLCDGQTLYMLNVV
jgi:hypothetical protein